MRTKEAEEAIDILQNCIADYVIGDFCVGKYCPMENECKDKDCPFNTAIDKVVAYISELEEENKKISDELIEEKQLNVKYLKIREEKENIIKKISLEAQKYFDMLMEVEYGRDTFPKQMIRDKIKELEENRDKYVEENKLGSYMEVEGMIKGLKSIIGE